MTKTILLWSWDVSDVADLALALSQFQDVGATSDKHELAQYNLVNENDVLVVLEILDRMTAGCFDMAFIVRPATTGSRVRHLGDGMQVPSRSRFTLDASELHPQHSNKSGRQIGTLRFSFGSRNNPWHVPDVSLVLFFPDDFGGNSTSGLSSLWCHQESHKLERSFDAGRDAGFLCQLAEAEHCRPDGLLTNLKSLQESEHGVAFSLAACGEDLF